MGRAGPLCILVARVAVQPVPRVPHPLLRRGRATLHNVGAPGDAARGGAQPRCEPALSRAADIHGGALLAARVRGTVRHRAVRPGGQPHRGAHQQQPARCLRALLRVRPLQRLGGARRVCGGCCCSERAATGWLMPAGRRGVLLRVLYGSPLLHYCQRRAGDSVAGGIDIRLDAAGSAGGQPCSAQAPAHVARGTQRELAGGPVYPPGEGFYDGGLRWKHHAGSRVRGMRSGRSGGGRHHAGVAASHGCHSAHRRAQAGGRRAEAAFRGWLRGRDAGGGTGLARARGWPIGGWPIGGWRQRGGLDRRGRTAGARRRARLAANT
mmetsp:Transcript_2392/g.7128  ORF Transcript_2392/g.7128 Transcript_2392/m.7128 type:complete len:323 (+) Transcript_2392:248-1216(+)